MASIPEIANFLFSIADEVLRDDVKRGKYPDVILPFLVLRRLDCVLEPTKESVLKKAADLKARGIEKTDGQLRKASGYAFYNTSKYDFQKLLDDPKNIAKNLRHYIGGFSENVVDILDKRTSAPRPPRGFAFERMDSRHPSGRGESGTSGRLPRRVRIQVQSQDIPEQRQAVLPPPAERYGRGTCSL